LDAKGCVNDPGTSNFTIWCLGYLRSSRTLVVITLIELSMTWKSIFSSALVALKELQQLSHEMINKTEKHQSTVSSAFRLLVVRKPS
jgi:hypothetical protein